MRMCIGVSQRENVCVRECAWVCVHMCASVRERERERESANASVAESVNMCQHK